MGSGPCPGCGRLGGSSGGRGEAGGGGGRSRLGRAFAPATRLPFGAAPHTVAAYGRLSEGRACHAIVAPLGRHNLVRSPPPPRSASCTRVVVLRR